MSDLRIADRFLVQATLESSKLGDLHRVVDDRGGRTALLLVVNEAVEIGDDALDAIVADNRKLAAVNDALLTTEYGREGGKTWLLTESTPGPLLADLIAKRTKADMAALLGLGFGLSRALEEAEAEGIRHLDLGPHRVLLEGDALGSTPRVFGFGWWRLLPAYAAGAKADGFYGAPEYMPSEVCKGAAPTPSSDLYSAAISLWALAASKPPFRSSQPLMTLKRQSIEKPLRLDLVKPTLKGVKDLQKALAPALEKKPEKRPSVSEWMASLATVAEQWAPDTAAAVAGPPAGRDAVLELPDATRASGQTMQFGSSMVDALREAIAERDQKPELDTDTTLKLSADEVTKALKDRPAGASTKETLKTAAVGAGDAAERAAAEQKAAADKAEAEKKAAADKAEAEKKAAADKAAAEKAEAEKKAAADKAAAEKKAAADKAEAEKKAAADKAEAEKKAAAEKAEAEKKAAAEKAEAEKKAAAEKAEAEKKAAAEKAEAEKAEAEAAAAGGRKGRRGRRRGKRGKASKGAIPAQTGDASAQQRDAAKKPLPAALTTETADAKGPDTKTPDTKTSDSKAPDAKSADAKSADTKSADAKSADTKSATKSTPSIKINPKIGVKTSPAKATEDKSAAKSDERGKGSAGKASDAKAPGKAGAGKAGAGKAGAGKSATGKSATGKTAQAGGASSDPDAVVMKVKVAESGFFTDEEDNDESTAAMLGELTTPPEQRVSKGMIGLVLIVAAAAVGSVLWVTSRIPDEHRKKPVKVEPAGATEGAATAEGAAAGTAEGAAAGTEGKGTEGAAAGAAEGTEAKGGEGAGEGAAAAEADTGAAEADAGAAKPDTSKAQALVDEGTKALAADPAQALKKANEALALQADFAPAAALKAQADKAIAAKAAADTAATDKAAADKAAADKAAADKAAADKAAADKAAADKAAADKAAADKAAADKAAADKAAADKAAAAKAAAAKSAAAKAAAAKSAAAKAAAAKAAAAKAAAAKAAAAKAAAAKAAAARKAAAAKARVAKPKPRPSKPRPKAAASPGAAKAAKMATLAQKAANPKLKVLYLKKALKLDPGNARYKNLLKIAKAELAAEQK